jgi:dihydrofolate reductase
MGVVLVDLSISLDGFIAGPNDDVEGLHDWLFSGDTPLRGRSASVLLGREGFKTAGPNTEVLEESFTTTGAVVMGRRWFDVGEQPWGDNPPFHVPVFVVTHRARPTITKGETTFTFVTDGVESAVRQAKAAAGERKNVTVGAAKTAQQLLKARLLDEVQIHLVPILLGDGKRLFEDLGSDPPELERTRLIEGPGVTHLRFRVLK